MTHTKQGFRACPQVKPFGWRKRRPSFLVAARPHGHTVLSISKKKSTSRSNTQNHWKQSHSSLSHLRMSLRNIFLCFWLLHVATIVLKDFVTAPTQDHLFPRQVLGVQKVPWREALFEKPRGVHLDPRIQVIDHVWGEHHGKPLIFWGFW